MAEDKNIKITIVEDELKNSYLDYSMSVIVGRALPDVRDGLKPVHRRILFSMWDMGLKHNKPFVKCARIVGDCFKYHPHGDVAVYESLVRMAQDFSLRYPLVQGHGNFGASDFPPAQMRYTEARLNKLSEEILTDIEKETVDFVPNFDGSLKEPVVLPSKIPNLLVNGSSGIAVGMATNIPPHNMSEVCDALINLVENPDLDENKLFSFVKGPDFPTAGSIIGTSGIKQAYKTGKGKIIVRGKCEIEGNKIIISEIPYQVNKSLMIEQIADLVRDKTVEGINDIRDESSKEGMRIVIDLKKSHDGNVILNQLYKHSQLQTTFGIINLALVNGEPKVLSLKDMFLEFIKHRKEVVTKRVKYELRKAEERDHILQGLLIALKSIDEIIKLIKGSRDSDAAKKGLIQNYVLTDIQANAILDMRLSRLAALEQQKILDEHNELLKFISEMKNILGSETKIYRIINDELTAVKNEFGDQRRTVIIEGDNEELEKEDLIESEDVAVTVTHSGYIKRQSLNTYRLQKRGGRGVLGAGTKEEDFVEHLFIANTHSYVLFFTDRGIVHWLKTYEIPEAGRYARGSAIVNLIKFGEGEKLTSMVSVDEFKENNYLVMCTKNGIVKKTSLAEYSRPRQGGIIGINLRENDRLVNVKMTDGNKQLMIATKDGRAVRFNENDVNVVGRNSIGVRGINARNSEVVGMEIADSPYLLTVTEKGYGKRSEVNDYRLISRGGSGVTNIKITEKNGNVVGIKIVDDNDEIMLISRNGVIIRTPVKGISVIGRNTQGVKIMDLDDSDILATVARIVNEEVDFEKKSFKPDENGAAKEEGETTADDKTNNYAIDESAGKKSDSAEFTVKEVDEFLEKNGHDHSEENKKKDFTLEGY